LNEELGNPLRVRPPIEPARMLEQYKRHRWLVYTASPEVPTVGWPMAVAEAQAAGVGVCLRNIRPDLADYLGGGGFLFESIDEVARRITSPLPDEVRERGFAQAWRSDVRAHIHLLEERWR
jgi:glycosyltransferase involved in cell wall biosynthesis